MAKNTEPYMSSPDRVTQVYIGKSADAMGGPGTFIGNLHRACEAGKGCLITAEPQAADVYLVVAESVSIRCLWQFWWQDRPIIHRLDGKKTPIRTSVQQARVGRGAVGKLLYGVRLWRSQTRKMLRVWLSLLLVDAVIYQSDFVRRQWRSWERLRRIFRNRFSTVIINGLPSARFPPRAFDSGHSSGVKRVIAAKGYYRTSDILEALVEQLTDASFQENAKARFPNTPIQIDVFGHLEGFEAVYSRLDAFESKATHPHVWIVFHGLKPRAEVEKALLDSETVGSLLLEDYPACPNAAFESQALGLPVIGSQGGANPEILLFKELLVDPFQKSPALFRRQLLFALEFCLTLPPQKRTQLADMTASAFGDNKFEEYLRFIEFVVQQRAHRTGRSSH